MSEEAREAKAEAMAAQAKAKALRPWYKMKRWWVVAGILVIAIAGANSDSDGGSDRSPTQNTIDQGIGSKDASGDIVNLDCGEVDILGFRYPKVTVKNNSSKPSDYFITIVAESSDGSQRYDNTMVIINSLGPGQTMTDDGLPFTNDLPSGAICKITEIQRTAS